MDLPPGRPERTREGRRGAAGRIALLLLAAIVAGVLTGCGRSAQPVALYDTEGWPPPDRFASTGTVAAAVRIRATVTLTDRTWSGPDPDRATEPGAQDPWRELLYEIWIEPPPGRTLHGVVAGVRLNEAMARWIASGMLEFGSEAPRPVDIGASTSSPRGLVVSRQTAVPDPSVLEPDAARALEAALKTPIWLKLTWDGVAHFIRLEPGEDITYVGFAAFGRLGHPGGAAGPGSAVQ
ncbi:MAG TPA: hypothetical protein VIL40_04825 [Thermaerobacter sp.]